MEILSHQTPSGFFQGLKGAAEWASSFSSTVADWLGKGLMKGWELFKSIKSGVKTAINAVGQGFNFLMNWFKDDPLTATAAVAAGALLAGVVVVAGGAVVGVLGGGLAAVLKLGGIISGVAAVNAAIGNPIGRAISHVFRGVHYVWNFNWQISDADIRKQQEQYFKSLIINSAGALGEAIGALVCGTTAGLATVAINVDLVADIFLVLNEDAREEIIDAFGEIIWYTKFATAQIMFLELYRNARKWIKANVRTGIKELDSMIKTWGNDGQKPWSFATYIEEKVESIDGELLRESTENFLDGLGEGCMEQMWQAVRPY